MVRREEQPKTSRRRRRIHFRQAERWVRQCQTLGSFAVQWCDSSTEMDLKWEKEMSVQEHSKCCFSEFYCANEDIIEEEEEEEKANKRRNRRTGQRTFSDASRDDCTNMRKRSKTSQRRDFFVLGWVLAIINRISNIVYCCSSLMRSNGASTCCWPWWCWHCWYV